MRIVIVIEDMADNQLIVRIDPPPPEAEAERTPAVEVAEVAYHAIYEYLQLVSTVIHNSGPLQ